MNFGSGFFIRSVHEFRVRFLHKVMARVLR